MPSPTDSNTEPQSNHPPEQQTPQAPGSESQPQNTQYLSKEEAGRLLKEQQERYEKQLQQQWEQQNQLISQFNQSLSQKSQEPAKPEISREEALRKLQEEGDYSLMFEYQEQERRKDQKKFEETVQNIKKVSSSSIASLAKQQARSNPDMPYFKELEKDVDQVLQQMNATATAENINAAYVYVRGLRYDDIRKWDEEKQKRQETEMNQQSAGAHNARFSRNSGQSGSEDDIDPETYFSAESHAALAKKGRTIDSQAKRMGFEDGKTLIKERKRLDEEFNDWHLDLAGVKRDTK